MYGMRSTTRFALICAAFPGLALAQPAEERVEFLSDGQSVIGTLATPEGDPAPVRAMYRIGLGREPDSAEHREFSEYIDAHGLANACRMLINSNEFMFVD